MGELAPYVKIVTTATGAADPARVLSLYGAARRLGRGSGAGAAGRAGEGGGGGKGRRRPWLVAFAMGEMGRMSRVLCLYLGSPYTYVSLGGAAVAPGQPELGDVLAITGRAAARRDPAARRRAGGSCNMALN